MATRLIKGFFQVSYGKRQRRLFLHSLNNVFSEGMGLDASLYFIAPVQQGLGGHSFKVRQGPSRRLERKTSLQVRVVKYWNRPRNINCYRPFRHLILTPTTFNVGAFVFRSPVILPPPPPTPPITLFPFTLHPFTLFPPLIQCHSKIFLFHITLSICGY